MKSVAQLVSEFYEKGIRLWAQDGRLRYKAPRGKLTRALRAELVERKAELVAFLSQASVSSTAPAVVTKAESRFPLSYGQQALWFLHLEAPESGAYNMVLPLHIQSELNVSALRRALQSLVERHPALRTTYSMHNGDSMQEIQAQQEVAFEVLDATTWDWDEIIQQVKIVSQRPFNLERAPGFRATLFTASPQNHVLLLTLHHIAGDAFSFGIMEEELRGFYEHHNQAQRNFKTSLSPLPTTYADYVRWERALLDGPEGARLTTYWQQQLAGQIPLLNLPTDHPRPPVQSYNGASVPFQLTPKLSQQLKAFAQAEQTTLFALFLASYQVLLHRYTMLDEIWVGSPAGSGRNQPEFAGIVGYLVNPLVFRATVQGPLSFREFLAQVRQTVLAAIEHQAYPFPLLVKQLQPVRDPRYSPLFQVMFVLEGEGSTPQPAPKSGLSFSMIELGQMEGQFDLNLAVTPGERFTGFLRYNADLFESSTIERMVGNFCQLLAGIVANPDQAINALPMLTEKERLARLTDWNKSGATDVALSEEMLHTLFIAQVEAHANEIAIIAPQRTLTYWDLYEQASQVAHWLRDGGAKPNTLVAVVMEKGWEQVVAVLAILISGAAYLPIDPNLPTERQHHLLEQGGGHLLLTQSHLEERLTWPSGFQRLSIDSIDSIDPVEGQDPPVAPSRFEPVQRPTDLAYVIYTSGSTGLPKGVIIDHRGAVNTVLDINRRFEVTPHDRVLALSALNFDLSVYDIFGLLAVGGTIVMPAQEGRRDPAHWAELMEQHGVTLWDTVPALMQMLVEYQGGRAVDAPLRLVMMSGDWIPLNLPERIRVLWPKAQLMSLGGATEASIWSIFYPIGEIDPNWKSIPYGKALTNQSFHVLDDALEPCAIWVPGQLYIGGIGLALGYWRNQAKTEASFIVHPRTGERLYKTGDLGRYILSEGKDLGNIEFLGRADFQVKIRGHRIELGEIEANLLRHPEVKEAVVTAMGELRGDKQLVAYIVIEDGIIIEDGIVPQTTMPTSHTTHTIEEHVRRYLQQKLPDYMVPRAFVILERLPLTANGKVNRRKLPVPVLSDLYRNAPLP